MILYKPPYQLVDCGDDYQKTKCPYDSQCLNASGHYDSWRFDASGYYEIRWIDAFGPRRFMVS